MEINGNRNKIDEILTRARLRDRRGMSTVHSTAKLEQELRRRRKAFLGSDISLKLLLEENCQISEQDIDLLAQYLTEQTLNYWNQKDADAEDFCYQFYRISIFSLCYGNVRENIDDIIQMASALVRSVTVFRYVGEGLLPPKMFGELYRFTDSAAEEYLTPQFEDSVLFAIATLLGTLVVKEQNAENEESEE